MKNITNNIGEMTQHYKFPVIASFCLALLLGTPVWWKTTEVYRADVTFGDLSGSENFLTEQKWPLQINIKVISSESDIKDIDVSSFGGKFQEEISKNTSSRSTFPIEYTVQIQSLTTDSKSTSTISTEELSHIQTSSNTELDEIFNAKFDRKENGKYNFIVIVNPKIKEKQIDLIFGKYRTFWVKTSSISSIENFIPEIVEEIKSTFEYEKDSELSVHTSDEFRLTFCLLNQDKNFVPNWNFPQVYEDYLSVFLDKISDSGFFFFFQNNNIFEILMFFFFPITNQKEIYLNLSLIHKYYISHRYNKFQNLTKKIKLIILQQKLYPSLLIQINFIWIIQVILFINK